MAINYPGPLEVRMQYTAQSLVHTMRFNVSPDTQPTPGTVFADIDLTTRASQATDLAAYVDAFVALLQPFFATTNFTFDFAEAWWYEPESFDGIYVSTYPIGLAGTNASGVSLASEYIYTFRTLEGGTMRIHLEEQFGAAGSPVGYASLSTAQGDLVDFILGDGNCHLGRDTSMPIAFNRLFPGQNERIFKIRYNRR